MHFSRDIGIFAAKFIFRIVYMKYNMNRKPVYETPAAELIIVCSEENFLISNPYANGVLVSNPFGEDNEEEL